MNHFKDVSAIQSVILALGITRLLSSLVFVFKSRDHVRLDWIPVAWALCVFLWQLQYAWAIIELSGMVETWAVTDFLALLVLPLLLFLAAALILPNAELPAGEGLRQSFERDGRWGLVCLAAYSLWSAVLNRHFWHASPLSPVGALTFALVAVPIAYLMSRGRRPQAALTIVFIALSVFAAYIFSPRSY